MTPAQATPDMSFLPLTFDTIAKLSGLKPAPQKSHLISPVGPWMGQAIAHGGAMTFGVFQKGTPVGLVSLIDPRAEADDDLIPDCLYVWRLMVDGAHEGQGIGTAIIDFARTYAALVGLSGLSLTTMDFADQNALAFYETRGFAPTGRRKHGEIELQWRAPTPPTDPALGFAPLTLDTIPLLAGLQGAKGKSHLIQPVHTIIPQSLISQETMGFGAFHGDTPVGLIAIEDSRVMDGITEPQIQNCLFIWQIMVDSPHEGRGFGTALVDFAKSYAQMVGLTGVALATVDQTTPNATGFYAKQGFKPTGNRLLDGPDDLLELVWRA